MATDLGYYPELNVFLGGGVWSDYEVRQNGANTWGLAPGARHSKSLDHLLRAPVNMATLHHHTTTISKPLVDYLYYA